MSGRLIDAVRSVAVAAGLEPPGTDELADALWLSTLLVRQTAQPLPSERPTDGARRPSAPPAAAGPGVGSGSPVSADVLVPETADLPGRGPAEPGSAGLEDRLPAAPSEPWVEWRLPLQDRLFEPPSWVAVRSPAADPLPHALALAKSLRPLRRRMPSRKKAVVDIQATVHRVAEERLWLPVHRPAHDRWLDLALVVDASRSMSIWRSQIDELRLMLERLGAFRDVRVWWVDGDLPEGAALMLGPGVRGGAAGHDVRELVDPAGLRVVLVVSDCVGAAWGNGVMPRALGEWGAAGPVAVLQLLPQRLWGACSPELLSVELVSSRPAAANSALRVFPDPEKIGDSIGVGPDGVLPVPVLELQPRWLARWAALVADPGSLRMRGTVMLVRVGRGAAVPDGEWTSSTDPTPSPTSGYPTRDLGGSPFRPGAAAEADVALDAEVLLNRYQGFASTSALALARCLAAAPLSLPVMRLVQQTMLPQSRPSVLAEVFLGGLLRRVSPERRAAGGHDDVDPDAVEYDFVPGVRERLLAGLSNWDKLEILSKTSDFIAARLGSPNDFRAFVSVGTETALPAALRDHQPFARVALSVLAGMGGRYSEVATRLEWAVRKARTDAGDSPKVGGSLPNEARDSRLHGRQQPDRNTAPSEDFAAPYGSVSRGDEKESYPALVSDQLVLIRGPRRDGDGDSVGTVDALATPTEQSAQPQGTRPARPSVSGGVPFRNPHFTGRDALLALLRERLHGGNPQLALLPHALHGMGGVGKTHLAIEYAWRFESEYDLIWWIPAESSTTVRTSLVALGEAMGVSTPGQETDKTISAVLEALRLGRPYARWLLVYDNARAPEDLVGLLPVPSGHVIVTSRDPEWSRQAALLEVDVFDRVESVALLQRRGAGIEDEEAQHLAEMLGDLPLALDQAAAWQAATGTPAAELARLLGERMQELLNDPPGGRAAEPGAPVGVLATWDIAFTELRSRSPGAARLLESLAFFGADPIAIPILRDGRGADLPDDLARVVGDDLVLRRAIRDLGRFALAKVDPAGNRVEVHRLVQSVLRNRLTEQQTTATRDAVHRIIGAANSGYPDDPRTHDRHQELLPHITPSGVIAGASRPGQQAALDQIRYRFNKGLYSSSVSLGESAVNTWRELLGPDDELTLLAQRHLAIALRELGEYRRAAQLNQDTLARLRAVFGEDHEHTLATMNSINRDLRLQARFEEARALDEDSVARHVARFTEDDQETVRARNNLAVDLRMLGRGEEALLLDQATYATAVNVFGRDHHSTLGILANLGRDLTDSGRYAEAVRELTDAARRARDRLGDWHRITHRAELNLVIVLRRSGEVQRARGRAEELHDRVREQFRPGHETVLSTIVTYANVLLSVGEAAAARDHLGEALRGYQEAFGPDHPFTQVAAVDLAVALRTIRDHRRARELDERALASFTEAVGSDHPWTLVAQINLAHDLALADQFDRACELSGDAYGRSRRVRGDDRPETMICGLNHALDLQATGDETQGSELLTQVREQLQGRYGHDHPAARAVAAGRRAESDVEHWET